MMSGGSKPLVEYPDSGPGPKVLRKGDETLGWFGNLTPEELFTGKELLALTGLPDTTSLFGRWVWVKVMVDKQVLFIPSTTIASGLSWETLYQNGLVYGDGTVGKYPSGTPVKQNKLLRKSDNFFRIRLFGKNDPDPATAAEGAGKEQLLKDYEFGRFISAIYYGKPELTNSWGLFPFDSGLSWVARVILTSPSQSSNLTKVLGLYLRTSNSALLETLYYEKTSSWSGLQWWPVLELSPSDTLIPIGTPADNFYDDAYPSPVAIISGDYEEATDGDALKGISLRGLSYNTDDPKPLAIISLDYED